MILFEIALFTYCFIMAIDIHRAKDIKNVLERGFISLVMIIAMLISVIAR